MGLNENQDLFDNKKYLRGCLKKIMENDSGGRFRKKKVSFSMISNSLIRDESISLKAKGLYTLIQSYITLDDFTVYKGFLQSKCCEGKKAFESAWKELKEFGYLVQYRMQDADSKQFYWEYELLDEPIKQPVPQNGSMDSEPHPQKGYDGLGSVWQRDDMENGGYINNTIKNNTVKNNTNQIISIADVMDQIGYTTFSKHDENQVSEIAALITDVLNSPDDKFIRIAKDNVLCKEVKSRYSKLNKFHIEYILECLKENSSKIANVKNYLLTALYNAPLTMGTYYQNKVNTYNTQTK